MAINPPAATAEGNALLKTRVRRPVSIASLRRGLGRGPLARRTLESARDDQLLARTDQ